MGKRKDLTGQVFGRLTALEPTNKRSGSSVIWKCSCACDGKIVEVPSSYLVSQNIRSCGCLKREQDLTGQLFGRLTVLESTEKRSGSYIVWKCRCSCGTITEASTRSLKKKEKRSCGCLKQEKLKKRLSEDYR